ncbi:Uncharacterized 50 kDa protein in type I retrotransposable element R1DM, partial [Harpegnathos saltator]
IGRPQKMGELRLRNLEISTTEEEAAEEVAKAGGCERIDVKTGKMRVAPNEVRSLWIQCPILAAKKIAEMGNIKIGWTQVKAEMLQARPLQCYKCLEQGHVQQNCKGNIDRRTNCYRCGEQGHLARDCESRVRCQICVDAGVPAGHRMGGPACRPPKGRRKTAGGTVERREASAPKPQDPPVPPSSKEGKEKRETEDGETRKTPSP